MESGCSELFSQPQFKEMSTLVLFHEQHHKQQHLRLAALAICNNSCNMHIVAFDSHSSLLYIKHLLGDLYSD